MVYSSLKKKAFLRRIISWQNKLKAFDFENESFCFEDRYPFQELNDLVDEVRDESKIFLGEDFSKKIVHKFDQNQVEDKNSLDQYKNFLALLSKTLIELKKYVKLKPANFFINKNSLNKEKAITDADIQVDKRYKLPALYHSQDFKLLRIEENNKVYNITPAQAETLSIIKELSIDHNNKIPFDVIIKTYKSKDKERVDLATPDTFSKFWRSFRQGEQKKGIGKNLPYKTLFASKNRIVSLKFQLQLDINLRK